MSLRQLKVKCFVKKYNESRLWTQGSRYISRLKQQDKKELFQLQEASVNVYK